jgi:hypothetical protein
LKRVIEFSPKRIATLALCFISLTMSSFTLVSCFGVSSPDGYLARDTNSVYFIQFTETNNQLSGHIQGVAITNDVPPRTESFSTAFTGVQNGSSVTITISVFGFSSSVTGTLNGNTLTLGIPQQDGHLKNETFVGASTQQYNQAVDALQSVVSQQDQQYSNNQATAISSQATATSMQATQAAQQAEQQAEQQAVSNANANLSNALSALKSDENGLSSFSETSTLNSYANDWQVMQKDYATEQQDAQAGCGTNSDNYNQVRDDAIQVDDDEIQINDDDIQLADDKIQYNDDLSPLQNEVQAVKNDWVQLQQAVAYNTTNTPAAAYSSNDVNNALQQAQNIEKAAQGIWQSAQSTAAKYDQEASALKQLADALPASMHCN